jgi:hypothetical protein
MYASEKYLVIAEQAQQSKKKTRKERKFLALAKEAHSLDIETPPTTKPVRAAKVVEVGALLEGLMDFGTRTLYTIIDPGVLRADDIQTSHAPLSGREGRARVSKDMETRMFAPGTWPDHVHAFTGNGMYSGPSKMMVTSSSEASGEEASDSDEVPVDNWVRCDECQKWRNIGDRSVPEGTFVCSDVHGHTCDTLEEPYEAD